jgi:hypothetical protein
VGFSLAKSKKDAKLKNAAPIFYACPATVDGRSGCRNGGRKKLLRKSCVALGLLWLLSVYGVWPAQAQAPARSGANSGAAKLALVQALVCEEVKEGIPSNPAIAFSISAGKIYCYTLFDQIAEDTVVYHHWFFRDKPSARIRLSVRHPRWSTFSSIQLREADKGPWRVEITDSGGRLLKILRFSVTD